MRDLTWPHFRLASGRLVPLIAGGSDDGGGGEQGDGTGEEQGDPAELGDAGKKALDAERARARDAEKASKADRKRADELADRLAKIEESSKSEHDKALEQARKEAGETAGKEATAKANRRIIRAEVKAAAAGTFADADDAVALLDLEQFDIDDDGEVDAKAIAKELDALLDRKPHLRAGGAKPQGSGDGGARTTTATADVTPGLGRLRRAYADSAKK